MQNNDFYSNNYSRSEHIPSNPSSAENDPSANLAPPPHYQSMKTIKKNRPSVIALVINALKIVSIAIICIAVVLGTLAKLTHGKALFLEKIEGEIIESEFITYHRDFSRDIYKSKIKIEYTYNSKQYTIARECDATKLAGEKVYVYVNMLDPTRVLYYDPLSTSFVAVPAIILIFVLLYRKFIGGSLELPSSSPWR